MGDFTNGHALVIGVGADLPVTVRDADAIGSILASPERGAYPSDQVRVLTERQATKANVLAELEALVAKVTRDDVVTIYYSGHGVRIGAESYLLTNGFDLSDLPGTALTGHDFSKLLLNIPARRLLLLLDCCHAGAIYDRAAQGKSVPVSKSAIPADKMTLLFRGEGTVVIASSTADELSGFGSRYSYFTHALVEAFCGTGAAHQDGFVRVADLALHTRERVPAMSGGRQHPILDFEQADNYPVAYYAAGAIPRKGLPEGFAPPPAPAGEVSLVDSMAKLRRLLGGFESRPRMIEVIAQDLRLRPGTVGPEDVAEVAWNRILQILNTKADMERLFARFDPEFEQSIEWEAAKQAYWAAKTKGTKGQAAPPDSAQPDTASRDESSTPIIGRGDGGLDAIQERAAHLLEFVRQAMGLVDQIHEYLAALAAQERFQAKVARLAVTQLLDGFAASAYALSRTSPFEAASAKADEVLALQVLIREDIDLAGRMIKVDPTSDAHHAEVLTWLAARLETNAKSLAALLRTEL